MLSENVQVWLRSSWGLVSVRLPKLVNDKFGRPQSNGFVDTPVMPSVPVMSRLKAYRFWVRMRDRLKSTRALLISLPKVRVYPTGTSKLRVLVLPPTLGNALVTFVLTEW